MLIYLAQKIWIALFIIEKIIITAKYTYFTNLFSNKLAMIICKTINLMLTALLN